MEVEVAAVVLAPSLGFGALLDDCGSNIRVEENFECIVTYHQCLDGYESATMGSNSV